jgi:MYXO-CTERM domain-containing protein
MAQGSLRGRVVRTIVGSLSLATAGGCAADDAAPIAQNRVVGGEVETPRRMGPLTVAPTANPSPETRLALAADVSVDARLLVITADGSSAAHAAITSVLGYLGTPYEVLNASTGPTLTADTLATGDHGRYQGVILDSGDLAVGSASAFTDDEWMTLASYEARFGVRRAVMYAHPSAAYGLVPGGGVDAKATPIAAHCTTAGSAVFVGANCGATVSIDDGWAYGSQASDASAVPLLVDAAGSIYAATRTADDGRESLVLTFAQSPTAFHTLALAYGVVSWVTGGLFIGEHHVYASPQIDDLYLASVIYTGGKYRITDADLQAFANWQQALRANPLTAGFRVSFAFNAYGAKPAGQDPLSDKVHELEANFEFINHTWDHVEMTAMSYADAFAEFSKNHQFGVGAAFSAYSIENLVTPSITGLDNADVMRAAFDVGIRQLVSDSSRPGQGNPSPNAGYYNPVNAGLLLMPRRPFDLYFNVSLASEWAVEYSALRGGAAFTYDQMIAANRDMLVRYLLRGENDPWMFHQANLRDNGGGKSLLSDLLDAAFAEYAARATFPVLSPTMDELADRVAARMTFDASGVSATIEPGKKLTVRVTNAAIVPVTGLCTPSAETYAGQQISYLTLAAGQSVTLSFADCNPGATGTVGQPGADGGPTIGTLGNGDGGVTNGVVPDTGGCGCGVAGAERGGALPTALLALAAVAVIRRRRR